MCIRDSADVADAVDGGLHAGGGVALLHLDLSVGIHRRIGFLEPVSYTHLILQGSRPRVVVKGHVALGVHQGPPPAQGEGGEQRGVVLGGLQGGGPVSYTHLDVYKRQAPYSAQAILEEVMAQQARRRAGNAASPARRAG